MNIMVGDRTSNPQLTEPGSLFHFRSTCATGMLNPYILHKKACIRSIQYFWKVVLHGQVSLKKSGGMCKI